MEERTLPWRRPRHELLLLALVAVVTLLPVYPTGPQDQSRLCLTHAIVHGRLHDDRCLAVSLDRSRYGGHLYSDKPPGLSFLALPAAEIVRLGPAPQWPRYSLRLWFVRVLSTGVALLASVFVVGRIAEGLAPGLGGATLVTFGLGTLVAPLAATAFGHVAAAAFGLGAFALAWRRRALAAGLLAGAAVAVEYQAALIAVVLAAYVAARGLRALLAFALGLAPGVSLLAVYNALAFGAPWHFSYDYLANKYASDQARGLFGIDTPHAFSVYAVFAGGGGLLVISPVLVTAAVGLYLLGRRFPAEALVCGAVAIAFLALNCGYFLPYGGLSPGPRFLVPALPFVALGLPPAFARYPRLVGSLALLSVALTTIRLLTWSGAPPPQQTLWGDLARIPYGVASTTVVDDLPRTPLSWIGVPRTAGAVVIVLAALAAVAAVLRALPRSGRLRAEPALAFAVILLVVAAAAFGVAGWPYRYRQPSTQALPVWTTNVALRPGTPFAVAQATSFSRDEARGVMRTPKRTFVPVPASRKSRLHLIDFVPLQPGPRS